MCPTYAGLLPRGCRRSSAVLVGLGPYCSGLLRRLVQLVDDAPNARRIDVDAGAHRAGQGDLLDVAALGGRRLRADDLLDDRGVVLHERALVEALLADRKV